MLYELVSTVALFVTVFMAIRNWFRRGDEDACTSNGGCLNDEDDSLESNGNNNNKPNNKEATNSCFPTRPGERKSVVFREEMNECFGLGASKSGDLNSIYTDEEAG